MTDEVETLKARVAELERENALLNRDNELLTKLFNVMRGKVTGLLGDFDAYAGDVNAKIKVGRDGAPLSP